ncbi:MAG: glycerophosphodiester phosphodiesterase family protein [Pseudomonadota bacterium]
MASPFSLGDYIYAHRGLWSPGGPPENSLAAYHTAANAGFGMEFDVRLSADGVPVCFHDADLKRMAGQDDLVADCTSDMLIQTKLAGTNETVPTLQDLLDIWPHHLPLLTEIKALDVPPVPVAEAVASLLTRYTGRAAAMSFSVDAVAALPKTLPRGLLIDKTENTGRVPFDKALATALELQVDYLSVWHTDAEHAASFARTHGLGLVVWTVTSPEAFVAAAPHVDAQIFEGFDPVATLAQSHPPAI